MYEIGLDAKLKIASAEFKDVKDVTLAITAAMADVSTRKSKWRRKKPTLKEAVLSFTALCDTENDTAIAALRTALVAGTTVPVEAVGGSTFAGAFYVASISEGQPLEDGISYDVSLELGDADTEPTFAGAGE